MGDLRVNNLNGDSQTQPQTHQGGGRRGGGGGGGGRRGGGVGGGGGGGNGGIRGPGIVPDTPFDFSRANAKFQKPATNSPDVTTESTHSDEGDDAALGKFYDRARSFFDDISSDSRVVEGEERGLGGVARTRREAERNRNLSTFGETGVSTWGSGGTGGLGGGGGERRRGGPRRRGGGRGGRQQQQQQQAQRVDQ